MVLDLRRLALLLAVDDHGSLGAAARHLGLAQPNASRTLRALESELGLPLVNRSVRGSSLTPQGRLVSDWVRDLLHVADDVERSIAALRSDAAAQLVVGASLTIGEHLAPAWLGTFRQRQPNVRVQLLVLNSEAVLERVRDGVIDVGFIESPGVPRGVQSRVVATDDLALVVRPGHPWSRRRRPISPEELASTPLVCREEGSGTRRTVDLTLAKADVLRADPAMELSSSAAVCQAVVAGNAPAVVPSLTARDLVTAGQLQAVPVEGITWRRRLRAVWRQGQPLPDLAHDLVLLAAGTRSG